LERNIVKAGKSENNPDKQGTVLLTFIVGAECIARDEMSANLPWPEHSVIAGIRRGPIEMVPRGDTIIRSGDMLIVVAEKEYLKMIVDAYQIISGEVEVDIPL
jgi:Trk K+ transport system NAD-binding subunit